MKDLLRVENLTVEFGVHEGVLRAVDKWQGLLRATIASASRPPCTPRSPRDTAMAMPSTWTMRARSMLAGSTRSTRVRSGRSTMSTASVSPNEK